MTSRKVTKSGVVVSDKMDKTIVVLVKTLRRHSLYKKVVKHTAKFKVHDEDNDCRVGDTVKIVETRPLSKEKHWRLLEILARKEVVDVKTGD